MDERLKNAIDALKPDEMVVKRLIESEVGLFRQALLLICWGLVFISFQINITGYHLSLYTTWLGYVLFTLGLYMLRTENRQLRFSYITSLIVLIFRSADFCYSCFPGRGTLKPGSAVYIALWFIVTALLFYMLFAGLRELAVRFENSWLADRLMRCYWLYIGLFLGILLCMAVTWLIFPMLIFAAVTLIYLPVTVNKLRWHVPLGRRVTSVKALDWAAITGVVLYLLITAGVTIGSLHYVNSPNPEASVYQSAKNMPEAELLRQKLGDMGMTSFVYNDLPDDEVLRFERIISYNENSSILEIDGGSLEATTCIAMLPKGRIRVLSYYRWVKNPRHGFTDLMSIAAEAQSNVILDINPDITRLSLYDINGMVYTQEPLGTADPAPEFTGDSFFFGSSGGAVVQTKYRLYTDRDNQRGYIAYNACLQNFSESVEMMEYVYNFNIFVTYIHQKSVYNRPYVDVRSLAAPFGYSQADSHAFESYYYSGLGTYKSEGADKLKIRIIE